MFAFRLTASLLKPSPGWLCKATLGAFLGCLFSGLAQTAFIENAWWTFHQDCDGDGCHAGSLPGDAARLNWSPDVTNCNGALTVYEVVSARPCGSSIWIPIYTNNPHAIAGCRSSDIQHVDLALASNCACRDFRIEIYRVGLSLPDAVRSDLDDSDLRLHSEEQLTQDACASDLFESCLVLSGRAGSVSLNNSTAGKQSGEPDHAGNAGGKSLWCCWTALTNTPVTVDTLGSSFDTLLAVYVGEQLNALNLVAGNDDIAGSTNRQSQLTFVPVIGTTYRFAIDGFGGASGIARLNWNQSGAPLPDLILWGSAVSPAIVNRTFTNSDCEVLEGCAILGTRRLLTFSTETRNIGTGDLIVGDPAANPAFHFASCHGHYHFEEFATYELLQTNGTVVTSGAKAGFCVADDHPWSPAASPQIKYNCGYQGLQAGWADVYVAGLPCQFIDITAVPPGPYMLRMTVNPAGVIVESDTNNNVTLVPVTVPPADCPQTPANDNFENPLPLTESMFSYSQFNDCASVQGGEPSHAGVFGGHSLWFAWTPEQNQLAIINTRGSTFDTVLAVYTGEALNSLSWVASNDDILPTTNLQSQVAFNAIANTTYHIAVDGWQGAVGSMVLNINPPPHDDFSAPLAISGSTGAWSGSNLGATKQPFEPAHAFNVGGHSIWFDWTAPATEPVEFNTEGSSFNTTLAVYTGGTMTNLSVVNANDDDALGLETSRLSFRAGAGQHYLIAVDGFSGASGTVELTWKMGSRLWLTSTVSARSVALSGVYNERYALLASTNMGTWSTQTVRTSAGHSEIYHDSSGAPFRYYRSLLLP